MDKSMSTLNNMYILLFIRYIQRLPQSRLQLMRRVQSIGSVDAWVSKKPLFQFTKLKKQKRLKMGKFLRNPTNEFELFGLRDENIVQRLSQPKSETRSMQNVDYEGNIENSKMIHYCSQVEQYAFMNTIGCNKCLSSISKMPLARHQDNSRIMHLSVPKLESMGKTVMTAPPQKNIAPHESRKKGNLPPILFQSHLPSPSFTQGPFTQHSEPQSSLHGRLQFGRIAEGIDQEKLDFQMTQKLLQQVIVRKDNKPFSHNLSLKKVNRIKTFGGGNILGKAIQKIHNDELNAGQIPKQIERSLMKEKERQIDELIFGKSVNRDHFMTENPIDMKDFI